MNQFRYCNLLYEDNTSLEKEINFLDLRITGFEKQVFTYDQLIKNKDSEINILNQVILNDKDKEQLYQIELKGIYKQNKRLKLLSSGLGCLSFSLAITTLIFVIK